MKQSINKINVATKDYRGRKSVLSERVIEGVSNEYDLAEDLLLNIDIPKTIIIDKVNDKKIYLPNAQTLLPGWKITIINNDINEDIEVYYYDSNILFTTVSKNKMTEILFLNTDNENDIQGNFKVVVLSEQVVNDTDIYTTNLYTTTDIDYTDLGTSFSYNVLLAKIKKNKILQSIYIRNKNNFVGANVKLDIGIPSNTKYFYEGIDLTTNTNIRDLFNEILNVNNDEYIVGNFYIDNAVSNTWNTITPASPISADIKNSCYGDGYYVFQDGTNIYSTNNLSSNITFTSVAISTFSYDSISDYSLQYINNKFYFFGVKNGKISYTTSSNGSLWDSILINSDIEIDTIEYITYNNDNIYIKCTKDNNSYIIYIDDITNMATWSLYEIKYNNTFISNIHNITCDNSNNIVINANNGTYYSNDYGQTWNIIEQYSNSEIYKYKYLNNIWVRFEYNTSNNIIKFINEFNSNINNWESKTLVGASSNIDYILDINYTNNLYTIFRAYNASDADHFNIITSANFFTTLVEANPNFGIDNILSICGDNNGYLLTGENGKLSYMSGNSSFIGLSAGEIEFIIEYSSDINPVNLLNPIIQGQIMPLGTIVHYPFGNSLPGGYARLDGHIEINARNKYPEFCKLLDDNANIMVYNNYSDYETAYTDNNGNVPKFAWVNSTDLRFPSINCFIRGFTGDIQNIDYISFYSDGLPNITGSIIPTANYPVRTRDASGALQSTNFNSRVMQRDEGTSSYDYGISIDASRSSNIYGKYSTTSDTVLQNKVIPAHIAYPYIMAIYHTAQEVGTYNLQSLGEELDRLNAQIVIAQSEINDMANKVPVGTILAYSSNDLPDDNSWMWCNGTELLKVNYPKLYEKIGNIYNTSETDEDHFNIPDISDNRFIEGVSNNTNSKVNAGLPNITGGWREDSNAWVYAGAIYDAGESSGSGSADGGGASKRFNFDASRSSNIYGNSDTVQPKSIRLRYIIKVR